MKNWYNILFCISFLLLITIKSYAEVSSLNFDINLRYRFELWDGMNMRNYGDDSPNAIGKLNDKLLYQRLIPGVTFKFDENNVLSAHMQDSRAFGWSLQDGKYPDLFKIKKSGTTQPYYKMNPSEEFFDVYDLYFESKNILPNIDLKIGRQKIFFGDYRIFGPGEWGNTGRWTWDAIKLTYNSPQYWISGFAGGTKIHDPNLTSLLFSNTEYKGFGIYSNFKIKENVYLEPFGAGKFQGSADYISQQNINRYWAGMRFIVEYYSSIVFDVSYIYEFGRENGKPIDAFGFVAKLGYKMDFIPTKPNIYVRWSYASGSSRNSDRISTFEPAFGASDKFYGWMNIVQWSNLDDRELVLELNPLQNLWIETKVNLFYIPEPDSFRALANLILQENRNYLGYEFNIFSRYSYDKNWEFVGVLGYFEPGDIKPIQNKTPKSSFTLGIQILYKNNFKLI